MKRLVALTLGLALLGCPGGKGRTTDTRSVTLATAKERADFLCAYLICQTRPEDAAFHLVFHDNSGGLLAGSNDYDLRAVVKVKPDDVAQWRKGCSPKRVDRPEWLDAIASERGWKPSTVPDSYVCGPTERRIVHVHEGLVIVWAKTEG